MLLIPFNAYKTLPQSSEAIALQLNTQAIALTKGRSHLQVSGFKCFQRQ
ncbi:hypothetical protein [Leptolyngbya sp. FACHB-541]|nr:hypothetical protein [Leptolyngbya sp. FACHB-541]MBD1869430.1 hypothetical protein [Cyanobacteria bacterium FACHB-471]